MKKKLLLLLSLVCVASCGMNDDEDFNRDETKAPKLVFKTKDDALALLPAAQRAAFLGWEHQTIKTCSLSEALLFNAGTQVNSKPVSTGIDAEIILQKTNHTLLLEIPQSVGSEPEYIFFGAPRLDMSEYSDVSELNFTNNGTQYEVDVEARMEAGRCRIFAGGTEIFSTYILSVLPVDAHYNAAKKIEKANSIKINPSTFNSKNGSATIQGQLASTALNFGLDVRTSNPEGGYDGNSSTTYQIALNRLSDIFGLENAQVQQQYFPSSFISSYRLSLRLESVDHTLDVVGTGTPTTSTDIINASPFGYYFSNIYGTEKELKSFKSPGAHSLKMKVIIRPPDSTPSQVLNIVNPETWAFSSVSEFVGSIEKGGISRLVSFEHIGAYVISPNEATECFSKRLAGAKLYQTPLASAIQLNVSYYDVTETCAVYTNNLIKDVSVSKDVLNSVLLMLASSTPSSAFNYQGWDRFFVDIVQELAGKNLDALLGQPNIIKVPLFKKTLEGVNKFLILIANLSLQTYQNEFVRLAAKASLVGFDLVPEQELFAVTAKTVGSALTTSYKTFLNEFLGDTKSNAKILHSIALIPVERLDRIKNLETTARSLGLTSWTNIEIDRYIQRTHLTPDEEVLNWENSLNGIQWFLSREVARLQGEKSPAISNNQNTLFLQAMRESWPQTYYQYLEKFSELRRFVPACAGKKDVTSYLACAVAAGVSTNRGYLLYVGIRNSYWTLTNSLLANFNDLEDIDPLAQEITKRFYENMWGSCSAGAIENKTLRLLSHIAAYKSDRKNWEDSAFKAALQSTLTNCSY